jgi:disulfide bond formation protein DsbB
MRKLPYMFVPLILFLLFTLTACGGSGAERLPQDANSGEAQAAAEAKTPTPAGDPEAGKKIFEGTCSACHGPAGEGVEGLGKDMTTSEFIAGKTDDEMVAFLKVGRDPSDPLNTTGVAMPPKGGNPALSEADLFDVVAYVRTLHK